MKYTFLKYLALGCLVVGIPLLATASLHEGTGKTPSTKSFRGPIAAPPSGNVAGVIWNLPPGSPPQDANINITGNVKTNDISLSNDLFTSHAKSLVVSPISPGSIAEYSIKPWQTIPGIFSGLKFNVEGALLVNRPAGVFGLTPPPGKDGRIQAQKFCFNPGAPSDCVTSWSGSGGPGGGGGGSFVAKAGDTMTGGLTIQRNDGLTVKNSGLVPLFTVNDISGTQVLKGGLYSNELGGTAITGHGKTGGRFSNVSAAEAELARKEGSINYGLYARAPSAGGIGADISGATYGIRANGGTSGSYFTNSLGGEEVYLGYPGQAITSLVGSTGVGLWTNGLIYTTNNLTVTGNIASGDILAANVVVQNVTSTSLHATADISAPNNTLTNCSWQRAFEDGEFVCSSNKFMTGIRKDRNRVTDIRCCNL